MFLIKKYRYVGGNIMTDWFKAKEDIKPANPKSNWAKGPKGDYDGVPRQYLESKTDKTLTPSRKNPWDK
jgi:hypothetical protein